MADDRLPSIYTFDLELTPTTDSINASVTAPFYPSFNIAGTSCFIEATYLNWDSNVDLMSTERTVVFPFFSHEPNTFQQNPASPVYNGDRLDFSTGQPSPIQIYRTNFATNCTSTTFQVKSSEILGIIDFSTTTIRTSTATVFSTNPVHDPFLIYSSLTDSSTTCGGYSTTSTSVTTCLGAVSNKKMYSSGPILSYIPDGPQQITFYVQRASNTRIVGISTKCYLTVILKIIPSSSPQPPIGV